MSLPFRLAVMAALALLVGCRQATVGDYLREFRSDAYLRVLETNGFRVEVRYLPPIYSSIQSASLAPETPLDSLPLDSLAAAGRAMGPMFLIQVFSAPGSHGPAGITDFFANTAGAQIGSGEASAPFEIGKHFWMEIDGVRHPALRLQTEKSWGIARDTRYLLQFAPKADVALAKKRFSLVIDDFLPGQSRFKAEWRSSLGRYDGIQ